MMERKSNQRTSGRRCLLGLLLMFSMLVTACDAATSLLIPPEDEVALGNEVAVEIDQSLTFHPDPEVQNYLNELGQELLAAVPKVRDAYEFRFYVVDDPGMINAFAIPGGRIYVYTGLILAARTEAEVAGVLGHEIAHVIERHGAKRMVAQFGLSEVLSLLLGRNTPALAELLTELATTGALLKYSRSNELQSDREGVEYMIDAGYNPEGLIRFFQTLDEQSSVRLPQFLSTHPNPDNRVGRIEDILADRTQYPGNDGDQVAFEAWQARIRGE
jgi:predicted Zn-dependent protease